MAKCIEKYICDSATDDCYVLITDENGAEIDTRFLHDGDEIYLNVPDRVGYTFTGFVDENGNRLELEEYAPGMYKAEAVCGGSFIAMYETNLYEVNVTVCDEVNGGTVSGSGSYRYNTDAEVNVTENDGFHFIGWRIDGEIVSTDMNYIFTVKSDTDICAVFEGDEYSIVAKPNNRNLGTTSGTGIYQKGITVTLTATPLEGSYFVSWDDGSTDATRQVVVNGNKVYVAIFARYRYRVTVIIVNDSQTRPNEECGIVLGDGEYEYGSVVTLRETPNIGFAFKSWEIMNAIVGTGNAYSFAITGDVTIIARFDDAMFRLTLYVSPEGGGITTNGVSSYLYTGGTYAYGTEIEALAVPNSSYLFDKWGDDIMTERRTFTMTRDITQTAYFVRRIIQYTLKINCDTIKGSVKIYNSNNQEVQLNGNGYVYVTVDSGTALTAVVTENHGYRFAEWDDGDTRYVRDFVITSNVERTVLFDEELPFTLCLCTSFNFGAGYVEITTVNGSRIGLMNSYQNRCVQVDQGTEIRAIYHVLDSDYVFNGWNITGVTTQIINQYTIQFTPIEDMEICPDVEYVEPFIPRVYINIDMLPTCKEGKTCEDMQGIYADYPYVVQNYDDRPSSALTIFPPAAGLDCSTLAIQYSEIMMSVGDSITLYPKSTGAPTFDHWEISTNGNVSYSTDVPLTITKNDTDIVYITAFYDCNVCTTTFTVNDSNVKIVYDGVTYNYDNGNSVTVESTGGVVTFSSVDNSKYMWKAFDVTNPLNPIDVTTMSSIATSGSFCYEPFPQTDNNGYYTFYSYPIMNYTKFGYGGVDYDYATPNIVTLYINLTTDTNYLSSPLYFDPTGYTWIDRDSDPNRNSFTNGWRYIDFTHPLYTFSSIYYRFYWNDAYHYVKRVTIDLNNIPTLDSVPPVASMNNSSVSPYMFKVACSTCTASSSGYSGQVIGYKLYCIMHEHCSDFDPWNEICYAPYACAEHSETGQPSTNPTVLDYDFISDKESNTAYHKRTNQITFYPECGHSYKFCGMDADFNNRQYMYAFLGNANDDAEAVSLGIIPSGATVQQIPLAPGLTSYIGINEVEYYIPASTYTPNSYVKVATTHNDPYSGRQGYYQVRQICS